MIEQAAQVQPSDEELARKERRFRMQTLRAELRVLVEKILNIKQQLHDPHVIQTAQGPQCWAGTAQFDLLKLKGIATLLCTEIAYMRGRYHIHNQRVAGHFPGVAFDYGTWERHAEVDHSTILKMATKYADVVVEGAKKAANNS